VRECIFSFSKNDVPAGERYDGDIETSLPCYLRRLYVPGETGKAFPRGEISIAGRAPVAFTLAPALDAEGGDTGAFEIDLDGLLSYADLKLELGPGRSSFAAISSLNVSGAPASFRMALMARVPASAEERQRVEWAVLESGYATVVPGMRVTLCTVAERPFRVGRIRLLGVHNLVLVSLRISNQEQLAVEIPGSIFDEMMRWGMPPVDTCPAGSRIEAVVRSAADEAVVTDLKIEGVDVDISSSPIMRSLKPLGGEEKKQLIEKLKAMNAYGKFAQVPGDDEDGDDDGDDDEDEDDDDE